MEKIVYEQLKETLYYEKLPNGLDVYVLPKQGFNKTFATFTTKYGSIDNTFVPLGKEEMIRVPDGIAHFLEHKLFEKKITMLSNCLVNKEHRQMLLHPSHEQLTFFRYFKRRTKFKYIAKLRTRALFL